MEYNVSLLVNSTNENLHNILPCNKMHSTIACRYIVYKVYTYATMLLILHTRVNNISIA